MSNWFHNSSYHRLREAEEKLRGKAAEFERLGNEDPEGLRRVAYISPRESRFWVAIGIAVVAAFAIWNVIVRL
ncbi:MAG: hypothetical protein ACKVVT_17225 [Dehalococcoidia bacterium]